LMLNLQTTTWVRFGIWMAIGLIVYFVYSHRSSRLARERPAGRRAEQRPRDAAALPPRR